MYLCFRRIRRRKTTTDVLKNVELADDTTFSKRKDAENEDEDENSVPEHSLRLSYVYGLVSVSVFF